jgi:hypothetical protein
LTALADVANGAASNEYAAAVAAQAAAVTAAAEAATAAANLAAASGVPQVGVAMSSSICAAVTSCTKAELLGLTYEAARTAKAAAEASLYAIAQTKVYLAALQAAGVNISADVLATVNAKLATADTAAAAAQVAANKSIEAYAAAATALGITGTTLSASTGTAGTSGTSGSTGTN